jgi:predicted flavoprotein YhiN
VGAFRQQGIQVVDFYPTNVGYEIEWKKELLQESEGQPLKNIILTTSKGSKQGECVITHYGLEGTPVYFVGKEGKATLDLKPQFTEEQILKKLMSVKENFSPLRRIKKTLGLSEAALSLIFHQSSIRLMSPDQSNHSNEKALREVARLIKQFPLEFKKPRPLLEAISCGGGVSADEVDEFLMLKKYPGIYCGGEMLDWTAPTGGYWIQGCVSQGAWVAKSIINYLK